MTHDEVQRILEYDADTGIFRWRVMSNRHIAVGEVAGGMTLNGYIVIGFKRRCYAAHRLAWLYVHGAWPRHQIDHINGRKTDNRIANLRDVTRAVNGQNQRNAHRDSTAGLLGVSKHRKGRWVATICVDRKVTYLGIFTSKREAHAAYMRAKHQET